MVFQNIFSVRHFLHNSEPAGELPSGAFLLKNTLLIAWPSILESFLMALVGIVDTIMVSSLGSYAIAAVGLTTQPKFICFAVFMALNVAVSAIIARRKGENKRESANGILALSIIIALVLSLIISALAVVFANSILHLAGTRSDTHEPAVAYFRIVIGGIVFMAITSVINAAQRGSGNTKISLRTNLVSNIANVFFNYLLINGRFGFPKLGVRGAAIATVIGSVFACGMSIFSLMNPDRFLSFAMFKHFREGEKSLRSLFRLGSNTLTEQLFLRVGFLLYAIIVAHLGTSAFAAHQIGMNIMHLSFALGDGLSVAAITLVGQSLGQKRPDLARIYGAICQRIGVLFSVILCIIYTVFDDCIFSLFKPETEVLVYGPFLMKMVAIIVFMQISQVIYFGCLRGGGDTRFTAFISLVSVTLIRPLSGWLLCYPLNLGLVGAWLGLAIDQGLRLIMAYARFKKGKWLTFKI